MAAAGQSAQAPEIGLERRVVGLPTAIGTTFSLIVASSVLATVAGGFFASWVWLIALAIGFITMIFAAMSFSELATMIPKAGSMNEYVRAGLGPFFATITVGVGYIAVQLFPGTAENFVSSLVTADVLGAPGDYKFWAVVYMVVPRGGQPAGDPGRSQRSRSSSPSRSPARCSSSASSGSPEPARTTRSGARCPTSTSRGASSRRCSASPSSPSSASSTPARSPRS